MLACACACVLLCTVWGLLCVGLCVYVEVLGFVFGVCVVGYACVVCVCRVRSKRVIACKATVEHCKFSMNVAHYEGLGLPVSFYLIFSITVPHSVSAQILVVELEQFSHVNTQAATTLAEVWAPPALRGLLQPWLPHSLTSVIPGWGCLVLDVTRAYTIPYLASSTYCLCD